MKYLFIYFFICLSSLSYAQDYLTSVQYYNAKDGLTVRNIRYAFKDNQGFMWFTSSQGAFRFDGYQFKRYKRKINRNEPYEMNHLGQDSENNIWFFHNRLPDGSGEISILPFGQDSLVSFNLFFQNKFPSVPQNIYNVFFSNQNSIHLITIDGQIFEYANQTFTKIFQLPESTNSTGNWPSIANYNITKTPDNYHYIHNNISLYTISPNLVLEKTEAISSFVPSDFLHHHPIIRRTAFLSNQYNLAPEQEEELYSLPQSTFSIAPNSNYNSNYILYIKDFSSFDLVLIDLEKNIKIDIEPFNFPNTKISPRSFFVENKNSIWLTAHDGVYHIKLNEKRFDNYLPGQSTREILKTKKNELLVTSDAALHKINLNNGEAQSNLNQQLKLGRSLLLENENTLWLARPYGSISKLNPNHLNVIKEYFPFNDRFNAPNFNFIERDKKTQQIWAGTNKNLLKYDSSLDNFLPFKKSNEFTEFDSSIMMQFFENDEFILIATSKGIFQLDPQEGIVQQFSTKNNILPDDNIIFIHQDKVDRTFWIGSKLSGLIHWDKETGKTEVFNKENGLVDNLIYAVYEDDEGFLWLPSNFGLMQFHKKTHEVITYTTKDGIPYDEFNFFSHLQDIEGNLYLGGLNGITVFHPKNFSSPTKKNAPLHLISFEVLDEKTKTMISRWDDFKQNQKITLQPNDVSFRLSFSLLDFKNPEENRYEYKIEGYGNNWIPLDENSLRLSNLPHGDFSLTIKGRNSDGYWSNQHLIIPITILQPIYSKAWFKIIAALALCGLIFFFIRRRTANLRLEKIKLEQEVARRTKEIQKQAEELKKLDEVKTRFFANVTHELRTPLTLIISPLKQLMKTQNLDDKTLRTLTAIAQNGEQLQNLVEEILDLSRYDANKLEVNKKPVHFLSEVRKWATGFDLEAQHRGIEFQLFYQLPIDQHLIVDDKKLKKIANNLLSNAFKFSKSGDTITFQVTASNDKIKLQVSDTGQGIHEEDLAHIFDRFFQSKQTDAHMNGGLGIGLALSKELANLIKGELMVNSKLGEGTTFTLEFPKEISNSITTTTNIQKEKLQKPLPASIPSNSEYNVLIVEDNTQMRTFIQELLHPVANTFLAINGKDALRILEQEDTNIHLIVSDVMMPEMDGFTLLKKIKASEKWNLIPVIMLTALSNLSDKLKAITIGVDDYLVKPFEAEELIARVNTLLQNIKMRKSTTSSASDYEEEKELPVLESADLKWLKKLEEIAFEKVTEPNFKVSQLAFEMAIGERQFNRKLKKMTGHTPGNYLKEIKLQKARQLLENKVYETIAEVSYSVGFSTPEYFSKIFKKRFGKTPSSYLK